MQDSKQQIDGELTTEQLEAVCGGHTLGTPGDLSASSSEPDPLGALASVATTLVNTVSNL